MISSIFSTCHDDDSKAKIFLHHMDTVIHAGHFTDALTHKCIRTTLIV